MSNQYKEEIINSYIEYLIENMSIAAMKCLIRTQLKNNFEGCSYSELINEIQEDDPEFLDSFESVHRVF